MDTYTKEEAKKFEDKQVEAVEKMNEEERATIYWVLNRRYSMTISTALSIRRRKKLTQ